MERQKLRPLSDEHETVLPHEEKQPRPRAIREWTAEIFSLAAAAAFMGAMVGLVFAHDKKPQDNWNAPITLNALVSVLSVAVKGCLLFSVCEAVGQWKWLLFARNHRPLIYFERVDRASRGPLGCVNILVRFWTGDHKDGFVVYSNFLTGGDVSEVPGPNLKSPNGSHGVIYSTTIPVAMESAIMYGLDKNLTTVGRQTGYRCPSSDCRWPPYKSLAVCSECNTIPTSSMAPIEGNVTQLLQTYQGLYETGTGEKRASGWHLPNGQFLANMEEHLLTFGPNAMKTLDMNVMEMTARSTGNPNNTITLRHRDNLLWAVSIMHLNNTKGLEMQVDWPGAPVLAQECGLYWCVNEYQSSVANNTYRESVEELAAPRVRGLWNRDGAWPDESLEFHDSVVFDRPDSSFPGELRLCPNSSSSSSSSSSDRDDCFWAFASTVWAVNNHFRKLFTANFTANNASAGLGFGPGPGRLANTAHIFGGTMEPDGFKGLWNWKKQDLEQTFAALAYSMSNAVRAGREDHGHDQGLTMSVGRVAAIYDMQWGWMSMHCATLLMGAAFLYLTIARTGEMAAPVFKSHSLAILAGGSHLAASVAGAEGGDDINAWARANRAKIGDNSKPRESDTHDGIDRGQAERLVRSPGSGHSNTALGRGLSVSPCSSSRSDGV
ncbi:hypothetical protein PG985_003933 [Apiospora marii]